MGLLFILSTILVGSLVVIPVKAQELSYMASPSGRLESKPTCGGVGVVKGEGGLVPAEVEIEVHNIVGHEPVLIRVDWGDGRREDAQASELAHTYTTPGDYVIRAVVRDAYGQESVACQTNVVIRAVPIATHRSSCESMLVETVKLELGDLVQVSLRGMDTKGSIQTYRVAYGDGVIDESSTGEFEHEYQQAGVYRITGAVQDSEGVWKESQHCQQTVSVGTIANMTTQPETGPHGWIRVFGVLLVSMGSGAMWWARRAGKNSA